MFTDLLSQHFVHTALLAGAVVAIASGVIGTFVVTRVLYLAPGSWALGTPDEVITSETLTRLYGTPVDVLRVRGRVVVVGTPDDQHVHHVDHDH